MVSVITLSVIMLSVVGFACHYADGIMSVFLLSVFLLSVVILCAIMLNVDMLCVAFYNNRLSFIMFSFILLCHYVEHHFVERHYVEHHCVECHFVERHYVERHYAKCVGTSPFTVVSQWLIAKPSNMLHHGRKKPLRSYSQNVFTSYYQKWYFDASNCTSLLKHLRALFNLNSFKDTLLKLKPSLI